MPSRRIGGWKFLLLVGSAAALVRWRLTPRRWAWLTHRRGEGAVAAAGQEIQPKPGDILLFHHIARLRDLLITMVTHSPFYHTALYAGDGRVVEARPQGVIDNDLRGREQNYVVVPAPEGKGEAALAWARTQLGAKFDRLDFAVILFEHVFRYWHINYTPQGRYTCAELVVMAFEHAGVRLVPEKAIDEIEPADLGRLIPAPVREQIAGPDGTHHRDHPLARVPETRRSDGNGTADGHRLTRIGGFVEKGRS
jgi:hypothetical protein